METEKIKQLYDKIESATPEIKQAVEGLMKAKAEMDKLYEKEYMKNISIDGKPARLVLYKRGIIEVQFRDMNECQQAIDKLLK